MLRSMQETRIQYTVFVRILDEERSLDDLNTKRKMP
jgi:hypothetical protein